MIYLSMHRERCMKSSGVLYLPPLSSEISFEKIVPRACGMLLPVSQGDTHVGVAACVPTTKSSFGSLTNVYPGLNAGK